jgi:hypothetical protein
MTLRQIKLFLGGFCLGAALMSGFFALRKASVELSAKTITTIKKGEHP